MTMNELVEITSIMSSLFIIFRLIKQRRHAGAVAVNIRLASKVEVLLPFSKYKITSIFSYDLTHIFKDHF